MREPEELNVITVIPGTCAGVDTATLEPEYPTPALYAGVGMANLATPEPPFPPIFIVVGGALL